MPSDVALRLRGGRIVDPSGGLDQVGDLSLAGGVIRGVDLPAVDGEQVVDVSGCWVTPGFIDIHTHLREPGQGHKETIRSGTRAAAAGGFTTVCAMANTEPVTDTPERLQWVLDTAARTAAIRVLPIAAVTRGLAGRELAPHAELLGAGACAFSDDGMPILDPAVLEEALRAVADLGGVISVHAEDTSSGQPGIDTRVAADVGCQGIDAAAEVELLAAHLEVLARVPNGRLHVAHVTTAGAVELLREARANGCNVTAEVTPHHLTLTFDAVRVRRFAELGDPFAKVNPPLRSEEDRRALVAALVDGTIDAIATDHAPHSLAEKATGLSAAPSGLTGLELVVPAVCELVADGVLSLDRAIAALTTGPARCYGLAAPSLQGGTPADVTVIDSRAQWPVTTNTLRSHGYNTPHLGRPVTGATRLTIHDGRIVHPAPEER